jgi:lipid A 3-O-deacylase
MRMRNVFLMVACGLLGAPSAAWSVDMSDCKSIEGAESSGVPSEGWNFVFENDVLAVVPDKTDEGYTQGLQFGYRFRPDKQPAWLSRPMEAVCRAVARVSDSDHRDLIGTGSLFIGQHLFTPGDIENPQPIPDDRPYAAWLYVGTRLEVLQPLRESGFPRGLFHSFELQLGTRGPRAAGEWAQRNVHRLINDDDEPLGWDNQLPNEIGVQGRYTLRALAGHQPLGWLEMDGSAALDIGLGTVQGYGELSALVRLGRNLTDPVAGLLGPKILKEKKLVEDTEPSCLGGARRFAIKECYLYVGVAGRATAFNQFLDDTPFAGGPNVDREPLTHDVFWGVRLRWRRFEWNYTAVRRSREFSPVPMSAQNPRGEHEYGSVNVRCIAPIDYGESRVDFACPVFFSVLLGAVALQ